MDKAVSNVMLLLGLLDVIVKFFVIANCQYYIMSRFLSMIQPEKSQVFVHESAF
jgi:hypothetical protein